MASGTSWEAGACCWSKEIRQPTQGRGETAMRAPQNQNWGSSLFKY